MHTQQQRTPGQPPVHPPTRYPVLSGKHARQRVCHFNGLGVVFHGAWGCCRVWQGTRGPTASLSSQPLGQAAALLQHAAGAACAPVHATPAPPCQAGQVAWRVEVSGGGAGSASHWTPCTPTPPHPTPPHQVPALPGSASGSRAGRCSAQAHIPAAGAGCGAHLQVEDADLPVRCADRHERVAHVQRVHALGHGDGGRGVGLAQVPPLNGLVPAACGRGAGRGSQLCVC
jgi:hypothetical protein